MKILVMGGTRFVGRHIVESLLANGHQPTLFHRGQSGADLFPNAEHVLGDRNTDLALLTGEWDALVDVSAYKPGEVSGLAEALQGRIGRALFISTISVYRDFSLPGITEESPRIEWTDGEAEISRDSYGGLKVMCEDEFLRAWGQAACILRPGIVAGPFDPTDRFTWWALGEGPLPQRLDQPVQWIDGRDLAEFCVHCLESSQMGAFNVVGEPTTLSALAEASGALSAQPRQEVSGWSPPMTLGYEMERDGLFQVDASRARAAGLRHRSLAETIADTRAWHAERGSPALTTAAP
jgi:2'-hydroxyisoflavone reductase